MKARLISLLVLLIAFGCVDRVFFDIPIPKAYDLSISGFISDQPGPYQVNVFRTFDIESTESTKTGITTKSVVISDSEGNAETLQQVESGVYQTSADGIRGKVGGVYKVKGELLDGRVYESSKDRLKTGV